MREGILLFKRIWRVVEPFHKKFYVLFVFLIANAIIVLFGPFFFGKTIDELTVSNFESAYLFAGLTIFFWAAFLILDFFWGRFEIKYINLPLQEFFSSWSFRQVFGLSLGQFRGENSGYRQKLFEQGQAAMQFFVHQVMYTLGPTIIRSLFSTAALFFINVVLGSIVLVALIFFIVVVIIINQGLKDDFKRNQELWGQEGREYAENLRYLAFIKANAQEDKAVKSYKKVFKKLSDFNIALWLGYLNKALGRDTIVLASQAATLIIGVWLTVNGDITVGALVIFFAWSSNVFNGLSNIGRFQRNIIKRVAEVKKFFELLDEPPAVIEIENPIILEEIKGDIEFKKVTFTYPARKKYDDDVAPKSIEEKKKEDKEGEPVLRNVSFKIEAGKTTAFVGRSGSGKTTMINLLLRAYDPQKGNIVIDGVDLKDLDLVKYRKQVGVVEQEVEVFDKTIKHNILFPIDDPESITDKQLEVIANDSGVGEFKERLEHGYETKIGEKGIHLSGGQKQRIGIARVLAKKPDILIFDEATSNLDSVNEKNIHKAMKKALKGRTGIIIAHRLATVMDADRIVVMHKGRVVGIGTHTELLKDCKHYQELVKLQNLDMHE